MTERAKHGRSLDRLVRRLCYPHGVARDCPPFGRKVYFETSAGISIGIRCVSDHEQQSDGYMQTEDGEQINVDRVIAWYAKPNSKAEPCPEKQPKTTL